MSQGLPNHLIESCITPFLDVKSGMRLSIALGPNATAAYMRTNWRDILVEKRKTQKDFILGDVYANSKDTSEIWEITGVNKTKVVFKCSKTGQVRRLYKTWHNYWGDGFDRVVVGNGRLSGSLLQL